MAKNGCHTVEQKTREPKVAMQLPITSQLKLWMIR